LCWVGCSGGGDGDEPGGGSGPSVPTRGAAAALARADSCDDLLSKIQDDAIAKVKLAAELAKTQGQSWPGHAGGDPGSFDEGDNSVESEAPTRNAGTKPGTSTKPSSGSAVTPGGDATPDVDADPIAPAPSKGDQAGNTSAESTGSNGASSGSPPVLSGPTGASQTNSQVANVEEADFVKVVQSGAGIFLLHGNTLVKLKSFPAAETAVVGTPLKLEGSPSELFVSDAGKAIVFSSAYVANSRNGNDDVKATDCPPDADCYGGGGNGTKITIADVNVDPPRVLRELYYEGSYVSSRRYDALPLDVVRVILQSGTEYYGLYEPNVQWNDAWGRPYDADTIAAQLNEWVARSTTSIRKTTLSDWLPNASEKLAGKLEAVAPNCASYYVPVAGLSDYGLTQVLAVDLATPTSPVGGVTVVGATSTVYSNTSRLVLAQPDYRWNGNADFGIVDQQRTALHVFDLASANTNYVASGWVSGQLPPQNPQFGIDVGKDGSLRLATTGLLRDKPDAKPNTQDFWLQHPETYVTVLQVAGNQLEQLGKTGNLGLPRETIQSARFVGDRAYVVTYQQKDPLVVVDVANPRAPTVLGQISIPGFSQYMHPLDDNHLITVGQGATWGIQLQLFDVTDPKNIPAPKLLDFGAGSSSEASYSHKAFTLYNGVLAVPVSGSWSSQDFRRQYYSSALRLVKVDAATGFLLLGTVDHAQLYADNGLGVRCGVCDPSGCYDYACGYTPEVRRGVFVSAGASTYVYSFSSAGVLVNDLANLTTPVAKVGLPQPQYGYPSGGGKRPSGTSSGGIAVGVSEDSADDEPSSNEAIPPNPAPKPDVIRLDAGVANAAVDAGTPAVTPTPDAG
jgi:hypothetical protein